MEDLQVFLYEDLLTLPGQLVLGGFMEVNLDTPLLLQQTSLRLTNNTQKHVHFLLKRGQVHTDRVLKSLITLYLLHVLGDGVLLQELCALTGVETLCVSEELTLEVLFVHGQRRAFGEGVLLVQTELDCRGENR